MGNVHRLSMLSAVLVAVSLPLIFTARSASADCNPAMGTLGTVFTIDGDGFGAKPGRLYLGAGAAPWKVVTWNDAAIQCVMTKPWGYGPYAVQVQPAVKGSARITIPGSFTVMTPDMESFSATQIHAGDTLTITGKYFGAKKGKLYFAPAGSDTLGQAAKVLTWTMDPNTGNSTAEIVAPTRLAPGVYDVRLVNRIDWDVRHGEVEIVAGSSAPILK